MARKIANECRCWVDYPNNGKKYKNGKWKCIDNYEYCGKSPYGKTICKLKEHVKK